MRKMLFMIVVLFFSCNVVLADENCICGADKIIDNNPVLKYNNSYSLKNSENVNNTCGIDIGGPNVIKDIGSDCYCIKKTITIPNGNDSSSNEKDSKCPNGKYDIFVLIDDSTSMYRGKVSGNTQTSVKNILLGFIKTLNESECGRKSKILVRYFHGENLSGSYSLGNSSTIEDVAKKIGYQGKNLISNRLSKVYNLPMDGFNTLGNKYPENIKGTNYIKGLRQVYHHYNTKGRDSSFKPLFVFISNGLPTSGTWDDWNNNNNDKDKSSLPLVNAEIYYKSSIAYHHVVNKIKELNGIIYSNNVEGSGNKVANYLLNPNSDTYNELKKMLGEFNYPNQNIYLYSKYLGVLKAKTNTTFYNQVLGFSFGTRVFYPYDISGKYMSFYSGVQKENDDKIIGKYLTANGVGENGVGEEFGLCFGWLGKEPKWNDFGIKYKTTGASGKVEEIKDVKKDKVDIKGRPYEGINYYYWCYKPTNGQRGKLRKATNVIIVDKNNKYFSSGSSFRKFEKNSTVDINNYNNVAMKNGVSIIRYNKLRINKEMKIDGLSEDETKNKTIKTLTTYSPISVNAEVKKYDGLCKKGNVSLGGGYKYKDQKGKVISNVSASVNYVVCEKISVNGGSLNNYLGTEEIIAGRGFRFDGITVSDIYHDYVDFLDYGNRLKNINGISELRYNDTVPLIKIVYGTGNSKYILYSKLLDKNGNTVFVKNDYSGLKSIILKEIANKNYSIIFKPSKDFNGGNGPVEVENENGNIKARIIGIIEKTNQFHYVDSCQDEDVVTRGKDKNCTERFYYAPYGYSEKQYNIIIDFTSVLGNSIRTKCILNVTPGSPQDYVVYRSIDINNPFPNNNIPVNWQKWYPDNKNRLLNSYNINKKIYSINYNKLSDYKEEGNYSTVSINNNGISEFVRDYFSFNNSNNSFCKYGKWNKECDR